MCAAPLAELQQQCSPELAAFFFENRQVVPWLRTAAFQLVTFKKIVARVMTESAKEAWNLAELGNGNIVAKLAGKTIETLTAPRNSTVIIRVSDGSTRRCASAADDAADEDTQHSRSSHEESTVASRKAEASASETVGRVQSVPEGRNMASAATKPQAAKRGKAGRTPTQATMATEFKASDLYLHKATTWSQHALRPRLQRPRGPPRRLGSLPGASPSHQPLCPASP